MYEWVPSSRKPKETPPTAKLLCSVPTVIISTHTLPFHCLVQDSKVDGGYIAYIELSTYYVTKESATPSLFVCGGQEQVIDLSYFTSQP